MEIGQLKSLISQIIAGEKEAYRTVILAYQDMVYGLCFKLLQSELDAREVTQDVFVKAYLSLDQFQYRSGFNTWLYRITYNKCIDFQRRRQRSSLKQAHLKKQQTDDSDTPQEQPDFKAIIDRLTPQYRDTLLLFYYQELSYKEIAEIMNISIDNVKIRLFRAKKKLKSLLEAEGVKS